MLRNKSIIDMGFTILCSEHETHLAIQTYRILRKRYEDLPVIFIADSSASINDLADLKKYAKAYKGGNSWSSLINVGMKRSPAPWNCFLIGGTTVRANLDLRYSTYIQSECDVLFPISDRKWSFEESTLNGLLINKNFFDKVGSWPKNDSLEISRLIWGCDALKFGGKFKAIQGLQMA